MAPTGAVAARSNPVFSSADIEGLAPEIAAHEPRLALDGGPDGLAAYRALFANLSAHLRPAGVFVFEVGRGQAEGVAALAPAHGFSTEPPVVDLAGVERAIVGRRRR